MLSRKKFFHANGIVSLLIPQHFSILVVVPRCNIRKLQWKVFCTEFYPCTSNWKRLNEAIKTNQDVELKYVYPGSWIATIVNETSKPLVAGKKSLKYQEKDKNLDNNGRKNSQFVNAKRK